MATENTKYTRIEDFLAGKLQGEALTQFEQEMESDPGLAEEVALLRDMSTLLPPSGEDALRANLAVLGERYLPSEPVKNKTRKWWWMMAAAVLLIAFLAWWFWAFATDVPPVLPSNVPAEQETPRPPVANETDTKLPAENSQSPQTPTSPDANSPKKQKESTDLFASNFQPNPNLELLLDNQFRGDEYAFRITQPVANAPLKLKNGRANFLLSGVLETDAKKVDAPFRVLLFSNKTADYENFKFLFGKNLTFEKDGNVFRFHVEEPLNLSPGLYYYLIEAEDSGMLFHVGKIKVQN